ncbi:S8 family serine peptidase [Allorhizocola rhizosphaerae]|uniref:S8 family serine peptidase n=1 Tax=Allorhizocola rhizosphaerae TaxID=1872709 RepID=UPI000E3C2434|nr:S8 family serine peptidase [Allorhizocola rhizosphaerae]
MRLPNRNRSRAVPMLAVSVVSAMLLAGAAIATAASASVPSNPDSTKAARIVTLITGDRVGVSPSGRVSIRRAKGRERVTFQMRAIGGHTHVVPADAAGLIARGVLDSALFDVTGLLEAGYGDAERSDLPVIVRQAGGRAAASRIPGADLGRDLPAVNATAMRVGKNNPAFWEYLTGAQSAPAARTGSTPRVWLNRKIKPLLDVSVPQIGGPEAWQAGYTGKGVVAAVLDTGVDAGHPDLAGKIADAQDFTMDGDLVDRVGHGTHVAATIASDNGRYRGVAPDATLVSGKVCTITDCSFDAILAGMHWAAAVKRAKVVNMSLGGPDTPEVDLLEEAVNTLTAQYGTLFVIAAGNSGANGESTVGSPSTADEALSVGAVDKQDALAVFSSRGPRQGDDAIKPDATAPGVAIVAARGKDGVIGDPGQSHVALDGTSMATPHMAGAAVLLAQQHPDWTPRQIKAVLMGAAQPKNGVNAYDQGAGRVDLRRAIGQTVTASPPSLSFARAEWPHTDDTPESKTLTYHNSGSTDVTLDLAVTAIGPGGAPAPASMFTLSAHRVTIPAGGSATVILTANTRGDMPDGNYSAHVTATGPGTRVVTATAVVRERESYTITFTLTGRDGQPAREHSSLAIDSHTGPVNRRYYGQSTGSVRLPRGDYSLSATMADADGNDYQIVQPMLALTRDTTIDFDARTTTASRITVDRKDATSASAYVGYLVEYPAPVNGYRGILLGSVVADLSKFYRAQIGGDAPRERFEDMFHAILADPSAGGSYTYNLAWFTPGRVLTGPRAVRDRELATVHTRYLAQGTAKPGETEVHAMSTRHRGAGTADAPIALSLPGERTHLFNVTDGVAWQRTLQVNPRIEGSSLVVDASITAPFVTGLRAGHSYRETWGGATVIGPSLPGPADLYPSAVQTTDAIVADIGLYSDNPQRSGYSARDAASTVITRDGTVICEAQQAGRCYAPAAPAPGRYRMRTESTRSWTGASTTVSAVWEWTSDGTPPPEGGRTHLPIHVVRYTPRLDDEGTATSGYQVVPVAVAPNPGSAAGKITDLTVEVSYDDGRTWVRASVWHRHGTGVILLKHPRSGYVSLRASAADDRGNTVQQTIIHAYRIR